MYLSYKNQHGVTSRAAQQLKKQFTSWAEHKGVSASGAEFVERDGAYSYDEYGDADLFIDATSSGLHVLRDPHVNKGQAFTIKERQLLGIHGLLPPVIRTPEQQMFVIMQNFYRWENDLDRYIYMTGLQDRNEKLFYRAVMENIDVMMPIIYTPTVGLACQRYGLIFRKPRGLFITIHDKGHIYEILCNWPENEIKAIVVTDGQRILGLGDLGAYGMGIPVGKLALYTACAGVKPHQCLPITLDVGTNNETLLNDPMYIGLRQRRIEGEQYDEFIKEFMMAVVRRYGHNTLIQFEDFGNHNAFRFLAKFRDQYCTFNDDIQGTASVTLSGLLAAMKITGGKLTEQTILFQGAGEAAIGIAGLIVTSMEADGLSETEALNRIWMVDSKGLIVKNRPSGGINNNKARFAKDHEPIATLEEVVKTIRPSGIIGVAAIPGAFNERILKTMAAVNKTPIIFALSNPTSKAECTAEEAYTQTNGACVFASGSPFKPVKIGDKTHYPGQANNAYIFPGVALAVISCGVHHIPEIVFFKAAQALADLVTKENLDDGRIFAPLSDIREASVKVAIQLAQFFYDNDMASYYPEPEDKEEFIRGMLYDYNYENFIPDMYDWPEQEAST